MKKQIIVILGMLNLLLLTSCSNFGIQGNLQNVGMLVEGSVSSNAWDEKGLEGLRAVEEKFNVDVYIKENIKSEQEIADAVYEFVQNGVNLIFGHSSIYGKTFYKISKNYPDVHFVYFNGGYSSENVTSLNFNAHAMGFFAGMLASKMSNTNQVGVIAAYEWQPEIEGFYEGVKYEDPSTSVQMNFINDWNDRDIAIEMYEKMKENNVDVFYPAGDSFSKDIIKKVEGDDLYAIGYVQDQANIAPEHVLTSTIQHVDALYELSAKDFNKGKLEGTVKTYDFNDDFITLGEFNSDVPEEYADLLKDAIKEYVDTGLLPNQ